MGLDDLVNKAKDLIGQGGDKAASAADGAGNSASSTTDKVKEMATDERIDQAAAFLKDKTPDNIDAMIDQVAEKAKDANN